MKLIDQLRNIWYAATHANQLIYENHSLRQTSYSQALELSKVQQHWAEADAKVNRLNDVGNELTHERDALLAKAQAFESALRSFQKSLSQPEEIKQLYDSVCPYLDSDFGVRFQIAKELTGRTSYDVYHAFPAEDYSGYFDRYKTYEPELSCLEELCFGNNAKALEAYRQQLYRLVLEKLGFGNFIVSETVLGQTQNAVSPLQDIPAGRIDYFGSNGKVRESLEYHNEQDLLAAALRSNYCGEPMSITVYVDPRTGAHIDTAWITQLDPPPQGFGIETYSRSIDSVLQEVADTALEENYELEI